MEGELAVSKINYLKEYIKQINIPFLRAQNNMLNGARWRADIEQFQL